jgi:hypothetical protein
MVMDRGDSLLFLYGEIAASWAMPNFTVVSAVGKLKPENGSA